MNNPDSILEENITQLLQAGFSRANLPDSRLKKRTFRLLKKEMQQFNAAEFPNIVLSLLAGLLSSIVIWMVLKIFITGSRNEAFNSGALILGGTIFLFNLISVLVSNYIILKRRNHA